MSRFARIQLIGPVTLFLAIGAAELAACALAAYPSSSVLWYLNLETFRIFQRSHAIIPEHLSFSGAQFFAVALPIAFLAAVGACCRWRFPLAVATNLSFACAASLFYAGWAQPSGRPMQQASLNFLAAAPEPDSYLVMIILATSFASFMVSHIVYLRYSLRPTCGYPS